MVQLGLCVALEVEMVQAMEILAESKLLVNNFSNGGSLIHKHAATMQKQRTIWVVNMYLSHC